MKDEDVISFCSCLFQVQRLAQYEQYFQSILCETRHDHEDISRAKAKAKQVGVESSLMLL